MNQDPQGTTAVCCVPHRHEIAIGTPPRITALDGLRGIAILAVLLFHYAGGAKAHAGSALGSVVSAVFGLGWTGVDLFFVLSGFLITGILCDTQGRPDYYKNFYARRALRIFPSYYLTILLFVTLAPFLGVHWHLGHLFFLLYLGYPAAILWPSLTLVSPLAVTHLWSLAVEEQFYLIWPWVMARMVKPRSILRVCLAVGISALLFRIMVYVLPGLNKGWAYASLPGRMDGIAMGAGLAVLLRSAAANKIRKMALPAFITASILIITICTLRGTVLSKDPTIGTVGYSVIAIACGALLVLSLQEGTRLQRVFSFRVLRVFGKYSYGLYLYHFPLLSAVGPMKNVLVSHLHSQVIGAVVYVLLSLGINLAVAAASFRLIEAPIMRLKSWFSYRELPRVAAGSHRGQRTTFLAELPASDRR